MSTQSNRSDAPSAWNTLFGSDTRSSMFDSHRASFRRKALRLGLLGGATVAITMHLLTILFIALPRGIVGGVTAFFWSLVTAAPSIALDVVGAGMLGFVLAFAQLAVAALLYNGMRRAKPEFTRMVMTIDAAITGALIFAGVAYVAQIQDPFAAAGQGVAAFVVSLVPLLGGAVLGTLIARRTHAYFVERLGK